MRISDWSSDVCSSDLLFHENVPDEWIDRCFAVMALTPQHVHQVLTKRPERMWEYVAGRASKLARFMVDEYLIRGTKDAKRTGRAINVSWPELGRASCRDRVWKYV